MYILTYSVAYEGDRVIWCATAEELHAAIKSALPDCNHDLAQLDVSQVSDVQTVDVYDFLKAQAATATWRERAKETGWQILDTDPNGATSGPLYYHPDTDRIWPLDDPQGAAMDMGMKEDGTWED